MMNFKFDLYEYHASKLRKQKSKDGVETHENLLVLVLLKESKEVFVKNSISRRDK